MTIQPQDAERLVKLLLWVGGAASTAAGAWVTSWGTSKIRVYLDRRENHRDQLNEKVLAPLQSCLDEKFACKHAATEGV